MPMSHTAKESNKVDFSNTNSIPLGVTNKHKESRHRQTGRQAQISMAPDHYHRGIKSSRLDCVLDNLKYP